MKSKTLWVIIIILVVLVIAAYLVFSMTGNAIWGWNYCDSSEPCAAGEGDCDIGADCSTNHCAQNVGVKYGKGPAIDVCEVAP